MYFYLLLVLLEIYARELWSDTRAARAASRRDRAACDVRVHGARLRLSVSRMLVTLRCKHTTRPQSTDLTGADR